jgi:hypothetical protein
MVTNVTFYDIPIARGIARFVQKINAIDIRR